MSRTDAWAQLQAEHFLAFMEHRHNAGISIGEIAHVFNQFDETEPENEEDFLKRAAEELLL